MGIIKKYALPPPSTGVLVFVITEDHYIVGIKAEVLLERSEATGFAFGMTKIIIQTKSEKNAVRYFLEARKVYSPRVYRVITEEALRYAKSQPPKSEGVLSKDALADWAEAGWFSVFPSILRKFPDYMIESDDTVLQSVFFSAIANVLPSNFWEYDPKMTRNNPIPTDPATFLIERLAVSRNGPAFSPNFIIYRSSSGYLTFYSSEDIYLWSKKAQNFTVVDGENGIVLGPGRMSILGSPRVKARLYMNEGDGILGIYSIT